MSSPLPGAPPPEDGWRVAVGLGNPGSEYAGTRHNVGFDALDLFAARHGLAWRQLGPAFVAELTARRVVLLKPFTYMNRSGRALGPVRAEYPFAGPSSLFVVSDDFHLPLGALRLRASGSTGGHKGLASIEATLQSRDYPRLRIGVGDPDHDVVDFVLSPFSAAEAEVVQETLERAADAVEDWSRGLPFEELQARYNRRTPQAGS